MRNAGFAEMIDFTRPGTATYVGADGLIHTAAADVPRFDYTNGRRQLLLEGPATNHVRWSSVDAGSIWNQDFTHNGIRAELIGTGYHGSVPYADYRLTGTNTENYSEPFVPNYSSYVSGAASGETWVASVYAQVISGTWPSGAALGAGVWELDASNSFLIGSRTGSSPTSGLQRMSTKRVLTNAAVANVRSSVQIAGLGIGGNTTFTGQVLRVFGWQLERASEASSLVQTTGGAVTRPADKALFTPALNGLLSRDQWTLVLDAGWMSWSDNTTAFVLFLQGANGKTIRAGAASGNGKVFFGGDTSLFTNTDALPGETYKIAIRRDGPTIAMSVNGESVISGPSGATEITDTRLGWSTSLIANPTNMATDQSIIWPFAVTDAELRRLSS